MKTNIEKKIKAVIFDVDGTILDSMFIWDKVVIDFLRSEKEIFELEIAEKVAKLSIPEAIKYLKEKYEINKSEDEIKKEILDKVRDFYCYEALIKEGAKECIEKIYKKNIKMIIVTSSDKELVSCALKRVGVFEFFEDIYTTGEYKTSKRVPDLYLKASDKLKAKPQETVVFEDAFHAIKTVKEAGFICVGIEDESAQKDRNEIKELVDYYSVNFKDLEIFD